MVIGIGPYLHYEDAAAAMDWLGRVLGFQERERWVRGDGFADEAEMRAGSTPLLLTGHGPGWWADQSQPRPLGHGTIVYVDDADAAHARAAAEGADPTDLGDMPWGYRGFTVVDPDGHEWYVWQRTGPGVDDIGELRRVRSVPS
ncbi:MAG: VOC family protein [Acidimicrobiales bacterium]